MNKNQSVNARSAGKAGIGTLLVLLVCLVLVGAAALNRNNLYDWWRLRGYQPPSAVSQMAADDTMTAYARHMLYVNRPAIDNSTTFTSACPNDGGEKTIVLGCYHGGESGIFLLGVSDSRLNGVEQVTAAHEMLHAAYERLSSSDRKKVDAMLTNYYNHGLTDPRIQQTIADYKQSEPHDVVNEMHSVFGTEVASLPAPLEQYYQRYFTNRAAVTGFAAQYQAEFTSRQDAVKQDDAQLAGLKSQIDSLESDLKSRLTAIQDQQATLNALRTSGNISQYNADVPGYNNLVDAYNAEAKDLKSLISQYNQLVATRNAVALQEDQLVNELSNTAAPIGQ